MVVTLNSEIIFEGFKPIRGVHQVRTRSSILSYANTANILLPASSRLPVKKGVEKVNRYTRTATLFKRGQKVSIKLGYNGELNTEFEGFVKRVNLTSPCEIECEGYSFQLRNVSLNKVYKSAKLRDVLEEIIQGTDIVLDDDIPTITLDKLVLSHQYKRSSVDYGVHVLDTLIEACGGVLFIRFIGNKLYAGLGYTKLLNDKKNLKVDVRYRLGYNTIREDMRERNANDFLVNIETKYRVKTGEYRTAKSGSQAGQTVVINCGNISSEGDLKLIADAVESKRNYAGLEGSIETFLEPVVVPGAKIKIADPRYMGREGSYLVDTVDTYYGLNGARRTVHFSHAL